MFWAAIPAKISALTGFGNLCSSVSICGFPFYQSGFDFLLHASQAGLDSELLPLLYWWPAAIRNKSG